MAAGGRTLADVIDETLVVPFPLAVNPHEAEAERAAAGWAARLGMTRDAAVATMLERTVPWRLAACAHPTMGSGLLSLTACLGVWLFVFDDYAELLTREDAGALLPLLAEVTSVLDGRAEPSTTWSAALADLRTRVRAACSPAQAARWRETMLEYLFGVLCEAVVDAPLVSLVVVVRSLNSGVFTHYPLNEAAEETELTPDEIYDPALQRLARSSCDIAAWISDLYSVVKEKRAGQVINLALGYERERRCGLTEAVRLGALHVNEAIEQFVAERAALEPRLSAAASAYVGGMAAWIAGVHHWSRNVVRYGDSASTAART